MKAEKQSYDLVLQVIFVMAMIVLLLVFYWTRVVGIKASTQQNVFIDDFANLTAFQLEQEIALSSARIKGLQVDYSSGLLNFQREIQKVNSSLELSELEKREKLKYLKDLYSEDYFNTKQALIDQEYRKIENLKRIECAKFCDISDL